MTLGGFERDARLEMEEVLMLLLISLCELAGSLLFMLLSWVYAIASFIGRLIFR